MPVRTRAGRASEPVKRVESPAATISYPQSSLKRRRDETSEDTQEPFAKRTDVTPTPQAKRDGLFMFRNLDASEDESLSVPPKSFAQSLQRQRRSRQPVFGSRAHRSLELGLTPQRSQQQVRQKDPFGLNTFDRQQILEAKRAIYAASDESHRDIENQATSSSTTPPSSRTKINSQAIQNQRSPAPEPETPRRGLFGSIGRIGSALFSIPKTAVQTFSPFKRESSSSPSATSPQPPTESHQQSQNEPSYPILDSLEDSPEVQTPVLQKQKRTSLFEQNDNRENDYDEESDDERKRKAFTRRYGRAPDPKYEHLHTKPRNGDPANLTYPLPKSFSYDGSVPDSIRRRRERKDLIRGFAANESKPDRAPLFGPDSHEARGTVNPGLSDEFDIGTLTGSKRKYDDSNIENEPPTDITSNKAYVEDGDDEISGGTVGGRTFMPPDDAYTPIAKRQKTSLADTPRSAMKRPLGDTSTIGRSTSKSVAFNYNPVSSVKKFTPPTRDLGPAGHYSGGLFGTPSDRNLSPQGSVSDTSILEISPTTQRNTFVNRGYHPGDAFTQGIKKAMPVSNGEGEVEFAWSDPNDPKWRPTLANPKPGSFRVPYDLDDEQESHLDEKTKMLLAQQNDESSDDEIKVPEQPQTPRMSHAELPKAGAAPALDTSIDPVAREKVEKARLNVEKHKPRSHSRLSEVYTARSRSPSPPADENHAPGMVADDGMEASESEASTPEDEERPSWTQNAETGEYVCTSRKYPDFLANDQDELVPSFCLRNSKGDYDDKVVGPDKMTEKSRQAFYAAKYANTFSFDMPQTYEEAGTGSKEIHELIRRYEKENPQSSRKSQENFHREWSDYHMALEKAHNLGVELVPVYPDRMAEDEEDHIL